MKVQPLPLYPPRPFLSPQLHIQQRYSILDNRAAALVGKYPRGQGFTSQSPKTYSSNLNKQVFLTHNKCRERKVKMNEVYYTYHTQDPEWYIENLMNLNDITGDVFDNNGRLKIIIKKHGNY